MGSLRNPIGPLPSSIYWRRRAVALAVLALLVLLIVWMVVSGGGGTNNEGKGGSGGNGPASTITPGPTSSGPVHSDRPGGRDEEDGDGGSGGSGGSGGEDGGGDGESGGSGDEAGGGAAGGSGWGPGGGSAATGGGSGADGDGGGGGGGGGGGSGAGKGGGAALPADSKLPGCEDGDVKLSLRPVEKKYAAGEKPEFRLTVENDKGSACKVDLGRESTVVTIKDADDAKVWTSDDCLRNKAPFLRRVPANGDSVHKLTWFGKPSAANCASPPADSAKPGKYEIEVEVKGLKAARTSFELT